MSTKSTILLTADNEHWYYETSEPLTDKNGKRKDAIVMEFSKDNVRIDLNDSQDLVITITNPDCELYRILNNKK